MSPPFDGEPGRLAYVTRKKAPLKPKTKRAPRPARREPALTPGDMEEAARRLHLVLQHIVEQLDKGRPWSDLKFKEARSTRKRHSKTPAVVEAIALFAERKIVDGRRKMLGMLVAGLALDLAREKIKPSEALEEFRRRERVDAASSASELRGTLAALRSESAKWKAAYCLLAKDADIWPLPDTRRGLRGDLERLYSGMLWLRGGNRDKKSKS